jgi:conjugative relaxase-like TrwC/TraI family protein
VLNVAKVRRGREAYYLEATRGSPERPGLVESDGAWWGGLAAYLGLAGRTVEAASLSTLLAGVDPVTGVPLDPRHHRVTVTAFDCTFAAPKSVSLLHALGPADAIGEVRAAHERAVAGALGYLERHAAHVRRGGSVQPAPGLAAASFLHRTSRANDPHLHTHLVVANLAPDAGGRWSALDARALFANVGAAGALYRAELRYEISRRLAVSWQARAEGFADLIGIPAAAVRGFSRRSAEITAELARTGWSGPHSARLAADRTRPDKVLTRDYPALVAGWREQAFALGVSRASIGRLGTAAPRTAPTGIGPDPGLAARVAESAESLGHAFDRRELIRATCARLDGGAPVERVEAAVDQHLGSGELVRYGARTIRLRAAGGGRIPAGLVEVRFATREVAALGDRLEATLESAPALVAARDDAGALRPAGTMALGVVVAGRANRPLEDYEELRAAAVAAHRDGRRVVGLAPNRRAAAHFEAATGVTTTVFDRREASGGGSLVVIADPERCPVREVLSLVDEARARGTTLVLVRGCSPAGRTPPPDGREGAHLAGWPAPGGALTRHTVGGVEVLLARDLAAALGGIRLLEGELRARGRRSLVVAAEPRLLARLGCEAVGPGEALHLLGGNLDLIVFGGARILGSGIARLSDGVRCHVAVAPVDRDPAGERSFALELVEPAALRRELGRSLEGRRAREGWRARAIKSERRGRVREMEPVPDHDGPGWARNARLIGPASRREPSLSR